MPAIFWVLFLLDNCLLSKIEHVKSSKFATIRCVVRLLVVSPRFALCVNFLPLVDIIIAYLSKLGVRVVDVGLAQLSMHSIREMCGTQDVQAYVDLFNALYDSFSTIDAKLRVD